MRVELSNLDQRTFNRACAQLDAAGIAFVPNSARLALILETDSAAAARNFVRVALHDPAEKVYR